jgi:hypothetical protein
MLKAIVTISSLLILLACTPTNVETNKADDLMIALRMATGGSALDTPKGYHETGTIKRGGRSGTYEMWGDLYTLRSVSTMSMGGATFTRGFNGNAAWTVGPDGKVQMDTSPEGVKSARLGAYLSNSGYLYPNRYPATYTYNGRKQADGKSYDVVTISPKGIAHIDLWLDPKTHLLQRLSGTDGDDAYTGFVEKYQVVDGVHVVFALTQTVSGQDVKLRLNTHTFEQIAPEKFSPPEE